MAFVGLRFPRFAADLTGVFFILRALPPFNKLQGWVSEIGPLVEEDVLMVGLGKPNPKNYREALREFRKDMLSSFTIWIRTWDRIWFYIPLMKEKIVHSKETVCSLSSLFLSAALLNAERPDIGSNLVREPPHSRH
ncbi:hypothetical protein BDZ89DRAFT_1130529 [Hymenopellis radicata]|nr:hypothetical protein BDZ89DRAFT_1130529 [Hymenopellis radicata]